MEKVSRQKKTSMLRIKTGEGEIIVPQEEFLGPLGAVAPIRIHTSEFDLIPAELFTHFNLQCTGHTPGKRYTVVRILEHGSFDGTDEVLPLLDFSDAMMAECTAAEEGVSYDELDGSVFEHSLGSIKDIGSLKSAILRRYGTSMPHLSEDQIIALGVAVT